MKEDTINLYLDDLRVCPKDFVIARTFEEAIKLIESNNINILSLDHDLGEDAKGHILKSGYDLVKYICENNIHINKIYIHTDNAVGRENMYQTLIGAQRRGFISENMEIYHYPLVPNKWEPIQE